LFGQIGQIESSGDGQISKRFNYKQIVYKKQTINYLFKVAFNNF